MDERNLVCGLRGLVSGRVQGVGFRAFVKREALNRGLRGRAVNLPDGRVEVILQGDRTNLAAMQREVARGPALARVTHLSWEPYVGEEADGFVIG